MKQDEEILSRLGRAADGLRFDPARSLERFHASRSRRLAVRRVATVALALAVAAVGASAAWIAWPSGPSRHGPVAPSRPAPVVPSAPTGTLAFMRVTDGSKDVAVVAGPVGGGTPVVVGTERYADYPTWSPDGTRIAFGAGPATGSNAVGSTSLWVAAAGGGNARRIVDRPVLGLSWSPGGTRIAYIGWDHQGDTGLFVVGADGSGDALVLKGFWQSVSWSPAGGRLLLAGYPATDAGTPEAEAFDLYTVRPDGTGLARLTHGGGYEMFATWSPDGSRILFSRGDRFEEYAQDVEVMDADGSNERQLTTWAGFDSFPVWSPDGSWIAFASDRDATPEQQLANRRGEFANVSVYVMRPDGSDVRRVLPAGDGEALLPGSWRA
jgi:Tol biopolymer transport system component